MKFIDFIGLRWLIFTHMQQKCSKLDHMTSMNNLCNNFINQIMFRGFYLPSLHSVSLCALERRELVKQLVNHVQVKGNAYRIQLMTRTLKDGATRSKRILNQYHIEFSSQHDLSYSFKDTTNLCYLKSNCC